MPARSVTRRSNGPRRRPAGRRAPGRSRRWLFFPLALLAALAALIALTRGIGRTGNDSAAPRDHIDPESRARLERVLRDAEQVPIESQRPGVRP